MDFDLSETQRSIRELAERICAPFDDSYCMAHDQSAEFPHDFHRAIADAGLLGIAMPEAFVDRNQKLGSASVSLIEAASKQGLLVACSASLSQGRLSGNVPDSILKIVNGFRTKAQASLQTARDTPW